MRRLVEVMLVIAILLDVAYWTIWFTHRDWIASEHRRASPGRGRSEPGLGTQVRHTGATSRR